MNIIEAIMTRRSIRKFEKRSVSENDVKTIIEAAMMAPSARNTQPWHFIVIKDRDFLSCVKDINPHAAMAAESDLGILVCADMNLQYDGYWPQDCGAAVENLLLAAHGLGLGAVWTGVYPKEDRVKGFKEKLGIPEHIIPFAFIPIGYPGQEMKSESRYKPERIHMEKW